MQGPDAAAKRSQILGDDTRLAAWPNPFFEEFRLEIPTSAGACRLEVVDFAGRVIEQLELPAGADRLQVGGHWAPGVYALRVVGAAVGVMQVTLVKM
ncbi:MAG: T9SS type A sorting domain-containing protein [Lewinellaceae bacterium]|nr:T9SS type A sorting domain-containing protein [Lewinellaceae bacterium]